MDPGPFMDQLAGGGAGGAVSELGCDRVGEDADVAVEEAGVEVEHGVLEVGLVLVGAGLA